MAISRRSNSTFESGSGTSITTTSAGATNGDILILGIVMNANLSITTPTNWTLINSTANGFGNYKVGVFWRVADGSGDDTPTVTIGSSTYGAKIWAYKDQHATPGIKSAVNSQNSIDSTFELGTNTVDVDNDDSAVLVMIGTGSAAVPISAAPTGFTSNGGGEATVGLELIDNFDVDTNGTYNPGNATAAAADRYAAVTFAIRSAIILQAPTITSDGGGATATIHINEGTTAVTTVVATGNPTPTYSITGGANQADYSIDTNTGVLTRDSAIAYGAPEVVEVTATNSEGTDVQTITVVPAPMYTGNAPSAPLNDAEYFYRPVAAYNASNTQYPNLGTRDEPLVLGDDYTGDAQDPTFSAGSGEGAHLAYTRANDDYCFAEAPQSIIDAASFTVAVRVRWNTISQTSNLFNVMKDLGTDAKTIFMHMQSNNTYEGRIWDGTTDAQVEVISTTVGSTSATHNVVLTYDGTTRELTLYINESAEDTNTSTNARRLRGSDYYLEFPVGIGLDPTLCPDAKIFRMAFWDRCLSSSEVTALGANAAWTGDDPISGGGLSIPIAAYHYNHRLAV